MLFACRLWNTEAQGSNETRGQRESLITEVRWEATEEFRAELAGIFAFKICLRDVVQTSGNLWSSCLRLLSTGSQECCTMCSAECPAALRRALYSMFITVCVQDVCVRLYTTVHVWRSEHNVLGSVLAFHLHMGFTNSGLQTCIANAFTNSDN